MIIGLIAFVILLMVKSQDNYTACKIKLRLIVIYPLPYLFL